MYDLIIIGAGPAGLSAAIYAKRAGLDMLVLEKGAVGGQISRTHDMENYPGIRTISGVDFSIALKKQAEDFGTRIENASVQKIEKIDGVFLISTGSKTYEARAVIAALGAQARKLNIPGEEELTGSGVSYCATCDGSFIKGMDCAVIGGGDTALEDAIYLSKIAKSVKVLHRRDKFRAQEVLVKRAEGIENIAFILNAVPQKFQGDFALEELVYEVNGEEKELKIEGCFIAVGALPDTQILKGLVKLDKSGYIVASEDTRTSLPGLFAAGDARVKRLRQVVTAAADGATAVSAAIEYLEGEAQARENYPERWCY